MVVYNDVDGEKAKKVEILLEEKATQVVAKL